MGLEATDPGMSGLDDVIEAEADQLWQTAVGLTEAACGRLHEASSLVRIGSLTAKHLPNANGSSRSSSFVGRPTPNEAAHGAIGAVRAEMINLEDSLGTRHVCTLNARAQLASMLEFQGLLDEAQAEWQTIVNGRR